MWPYAPPLRLGLLERRILFITISTEPHQPLFDKGNNEVAFDCACLDVNREIIELAQAVHGLSLYVKSGGLYKLGSDHQWHKV